MTTSLSSALSQTLHHHKLETYRNTSEKQVSSFFLQYIRFLLDVFSAEAQLNQGTLEHSEVHSLDGTFLNTLESTLE